MAGYEDIWFLGDEFLVKTFGPCIQNIYGDNDRELYLRQHFNMITFCTGSTNASLRGCNVIGHVHNNYIQAINDHVLLPKYLIICVEDDILKAVNHYKSGSDLAYAPLVKWLSMEIHRCTTAYKEKLPTKARKFKYPQILWPLLVFHDDFSDNYYRDKFNGCILSAILRHRNMYSLRVLTWDNSDRNLVSNGSMTSKGTHCYWEALNDAFMAWDKDQMRGAHSSGPSRGAHNDRYHWTRNNKRHNNDRRSYRKY